MVDGQHLNFRRKAVADRSIDEMIGLSHGLLADGILNRDEVEYLQKWLASRPSLHDHPILYQLFERVNDYLSDGVLHNEEYDDLKDTLSKLCGGDFELGEIAKATTLPFCNPQPKLIIAGNRFTFTGTFNFGNRKSCEQAVIDRNATAGSLTKNTNYLVVGTYATDSWKHSSFGNKILKAVDFKEQGHNIYIINEAHWLNSLEVTP